MNVFPELRALFRQMELSVGHDSTGGKLIILAVSQAVAVYQPVSQAAGYAGCGLLLTHTLDYALQCINKICACKL